MIDNETESNIGNFNIHFDSLLIKKAMYFDRGL